MLFLVQIATKLVFKMYRCGEPEQSLCLPPKQHQNGNVFTDNLILPSQNWLVRILSRWHWSSFNDKAAASFPHPLSISSGDSFPAVLRYDLTRLWCCKMLAGTNQTFFFFLKDNILLFQSQLTLRANEMGRARGQLLKDIHKTFLVYTAFIQGLQITGKRKEIVISSYHFSMVTNKML